MTQASQPADGSEPGNTYDQLPYPGAPFAQSHPVRLATVGRLFGMSPAPVAQCRVLELGCTDGGNLIPIAASFPESSCLGVDLSARQINTGRGIVEALKLGNIRLEHRDIATVGAEYGKFDYIITHGVYSWVSEPVQDRILAIARELLNPQGIAYISYNTFPGWHMRGMIRDMMLYHTRQFSDTQIRIDQARALVNFLADAVPTRNSPYGLLLSNELTSLRSWSDAYIFHELLEVHNQPTFFHEFVDRASRHGLRFLGEANFGSMLPGDFAPAISATLQEIGRGIVEMEQYMDFVRNRTFRQTLLCHSEISLNRSLGTASCDSMYLRSRLQPTVVDLDPLAEGGVEFSTPSGASVVVKTPIQKAAFLALSQAYPQSLHFDELLQRARAMSQPQSLAIQDAHTLAAEAEDLRDALFRCFCESLVEFQAFPSPCAIRPGERPVASPVARLQARSAKEVTNLSHEIIPVDVVNAHLLQLLDGTRDRPALTEALIQLAGEGQIVATRNGQVLDNKEEYAAVLSDQLETRLHDLARSALLIA
jgi:methyltransferase-like protein/trans-aconitate methyltransferase